MSRRRIAAIPLRLGRRYREFESHRLDIDQKFSGFVKLEISTKCVDSSRIFSLPACSFLWQFEQTTTHLDISSIIDSNDLNPETRFETVALLVLGSR